MSEGLFFPQQTSGASGAINNPSQFEQDSFSDYTKAAVGNTNLTSTVSTNPLGDYFSDTNACKFLTKTLWIKDLVLEEDRSKWVNGGVTYRVIFTENFSGISAYVAGYKELKSEINGKSVVIQSLGSVFGVSGTILKASFIVKPQVPNSGFIYTSDNASSATVLTGLFGDESGGYQGAPGNANYINDQHKYFLADANSNSSDDLHDFRIKLSGEITIEVLGIVLVLGTSPNEVITRPGNTYVNKVLATAGASTSTITMAAQNASLFHLGSKTTIYRTATSESIYATTIPVPLLQTQATGLSGTTSIAVSAGTGASFPIGTGIGIQNGASLYYGIVRAQSTDTLTVSPTLAWGVSGSTLTKAFFIPGPSVMRTSNLDMTQYELSCSWDPVLSYGASSWASGAFYTADGATVPASGFSNIPYLAYYDPENRYVVLPITGVSSAQGRIMMSGNGFNGWRGPLSVKGDFQAIEFEYFIGNTALQIGGAALDGITIYPNGATLARNTTLPNFTKVLIAQDLGIGWHSLKFSDDNPIVPGSTVNVGNPLITKVNFYKYKGYSMLGMLATVEEKQTSFNNSVGSTNGLPLGTHTFYGSDKLTYSGSWFKQLAIIASTMSVFPGFAQCIGSSSNSVMTFKYWGKNFVLYADAAGGSYSVTLDGASVGPTPGLIESVATETIHTLVVTRQSGTFGIRGIAILKDYNEIVCKQNFTAVPGLLELDGSKLTDKSVGIIKSGRRAIGYSVGLGGMALSNITSTNVGASNWVSISETINLQTSGNPVLFGFCQNGVTVPGTASPVITLLGGANLTGQGAQLYITRWPEGSTMFLRSNTTAGIMPIGTSLLNGIVSQDSFGFRAGVTSAVGATLSGAYPLASKKYIDIPPAGKWQYQAWLAVDSAGITAVVANVQIFAMEMF